MGSYDKYQTNVGRAQGGNIFFVKDGGFIDMESGGFLNLKSGAYLTALNGGAVRIGQTGLQRFYDQDFTGSRLKFMHLSLDTITNYISSVSTLAVSVLLPGYGYALFSAATGCSLCSIKLPSAEVGARLVMNFSGFAGDANASIFAASAGGNASLTGLHGSDISVIMVSEAAYIEMVCAVEGLWQIVASNNSVGEQASA